MQETIQIDEQLQQLKSTISKRLLGTESAIELLLITLLAQGHALIEGEPGLGKSSLANALADSISASFARIQFTADLMPADILGYTLYRPEEHRFEFIKGPIFNQIVLADEINRSSSRVQSALLEAMNEQQVSIDGISYSLPNGFMVIATQNPVASVGTFPLPEAQLDRFLLSIPLGPPNQYQLKEIIQHHLSHHQPLKTEAILDVPALETLQSKVKTIHVSDLIIDYMIALCDEIRCDPQLIGTLSIRATLALTRAAQAASLINDNSAVYPEAIKRVLPYCFAHRIQYQAEPTHQACLDYLQALCVRLPTP
jgi:MoxR-like ATPase